MRDEEANQIADALRGLLYQACPHATAWSITATAREIAHRVDDPPREPVAEALELATFLGGEPLQLRRADLTGALLNGVNLSRADLSEANLSGALLHRAILYETNLRGANLTEASLPDASLIDANMSHADLSRADLRGAFMSGAYLRGADLSDADLRCTRSYGVDLTGAILPSANLAGADLSGAILLGADLAETSNLLLPRNATWDQDTRWPAALVTKVEDQSDEIRPGIYRVRDRPETDRSAVRS